MVKMTTGIGNNAAWMACLDAWDKIKEHPNIKRCVKGGGNPYNEFKHCFRMFHDYELALIYNDNQPFFKVSEMSEEARKTFGKISDRQYYELWAASGFYAYGKTKDFFTSLVKKFRLAYAKYGAKEPEILAWADAACQLLNLANSIYDAAIDACFKSYPSVRRSKFDEIYHDFSIKPINERWFCAMKDLDPVTDTTFDSTERRNIQLGIEQIRELWMNGDMLWGARIETAQDYAELFRTNGEMKKAVSWFKERKEEIKKFLK